MSLRVALAAPYKRAGRERLSEQRFVVDLTVERDWLSPAEATRLIELGKRRDLLAVEEEDLLATFDPAEVTVPDGFRPDSSLLEERSPVEVVIDALVDVGFDRREAVATINAYQDRLSITSGAAAVLAARASGLVVPAAAARVREELTG